MNRRAALLLGAATLMISLGMSLAADQCGKAAWFAPGGLTASGEPNSVGVLTAAHPTLPFGTKVRVVNLGNNRSVVVRINDRGRFPGNRIIDVSQTAAKRLDFIRAGVANVRISVPDSTDAAWKEDCAEALAPADGGAAATATLETLPGETLAKRFSTDFHPETWSEFELRKAIEAVLPLEAPASRVR